MTNTQNDSPDSPDSPDKTLTQSEIENTINTDTDMAGHNVNANASKTDDLRPVTPRLAQRHILYIQMQYCSQKTLRDFLSSPEARKMKKSANNKNNDKKDSSSTTKINLQHALELFGQVASGVKHVHSQSLIHRDLKPSNCFIDVSGTVKIGDFGLSRESGDENKHSAQQQNTTQTQTDESLDRGDVGKGMQNTAGVGTYMYASPEVSC